MSTLDCISFSPLFVLNLHERAGGPNRGGATRFDLFIFIFFELFSPHQKYQSLLCVFLHSASDVTQCQTCISQTSHPSVCRAHARTAALELDLTLFRLRLDQTCTGPGSDLRSSDLGGPVKTSSLGDEGIRSKVKAMCCSEGQWLVLMFNLNDFKASNGLFQHLHFVSHTCFAVLKSIPHNKTPDDIIGGSFSDLTRRI